MLRGFVSMVRVHTSCRSQARASLPGWARSMATKESAEEPTMDLDGGVVNGKDMIFKSEFMKAMYERGYLHQCTSPEGLDRAMSSGKIKAYLGFDATAKSLHVGSLVQLMILRLLQKTGHTPIVLVGGGTSRVGDPSGKDQARQLLSTADIEGNIAHMTKVFSTFLDFKASKSCPNPAIMVNNANWLGKLNYIDFLRDYGKYFSVNRMLTFDSVKTRLAREEPLSFLEFNYMVLQAYDFNYISEKHGAVLQIGGSDQWGNMVSGIELARKARRVHLNGLTAPLITTSDGRKMGKSESGAIWLDRDMLSEFEYWQFWRNVADTDVSRFLKLFTELPLDEIDVLTRDGGASLNAAKVVLADEATRILHGEECLPKIHKTIGGIYRPSNSDISISEDIDDDDDPMDALPEVVFTSGKILASYGDDPSAPVGVDLGEALMLCRLAASRGEGRRLVKGGGVKVNDEKITDEYMVLDQSHFCHRGRVKLSVGKKRHVAFLVPSELWDSASSPPVAEAAPEALPVEKKQNDEGKKAKAKSSKAIDTEAAVPKKKVSRAKKSEKKQESGADDEAAPSPNIEKRKRVKKAPSSSTE